MKYFILTLTLSFLCSPSLVYSGDLDVPQAEQQEDDFENLLSQEELEQIKQEAARQSRKSTSNEESPKKADEDLVNPYASLLKEKGVKTQADKKEEALAPKVKKYKKHTSTTRTYDRYKTGNRRPGDALKSTPAQRAFGK